VVVGAGPTPALGLRIGDPLGPSMAASVVAGLQQPAVVVIHPTAARAVPQLRRLRRARAGLRIILLSTHREAPCPEDVDEILPVDASDDVVMGRVVIQLAEARAAAPRRLPVADDTILDIDARALRRHGRLIRLRPLESRLLEELARSPGRPLTRDWLVERAWPSPPPHGSRTVDVHVRWLRQKLEPDPRRPIHLLTVRGLGYQLEPDPPADISSPA
jgi:DNA-binding response OmpR family regulator